VAERGTLLETTVVGEEEKEVVEEREVVEAHDKEEADAREAEEPE
jgi:hypothetical protein